MNLLTLHIIEISNYELKGYYNDNKEKTTRII